MNEHRPVATAVLDVRGMLRASEKGVVETVLTRRPGVERVEANPVAQTATVRYDPDQTSLRELRRWVEECGYHCAGQSVPSHVCDPLMEPGGHSGHGATAAGHAGHEGMSMAAMVADMRNRFLVAAVFSVPILLWSPIGREVLGFRTAAPFGLRDDGARPARPHPGHDGAGRGRRRGGLAVLGGGHAQRRR